MLRVRLQLLAILFSPPHRSFLFDLTFNFPQQFRKSPNRQQRASVSLNFTSKTLDLVDVFIISTASHLTEMFHIRKIYIRLRFCLIHTHKSSRKIIYSRCEPSFNKPWSNLLITPTPHANLLPSWCRRTLTLQRSGSTQFVTSSGLVGIEQLQLLVSLGVKGRIFSIHPPTTSQVHPQITHTSLVTLELAHHT